MEGVRSTCPYCGVGCGVIAGADKIIGDPNHPANFGQLCVKGAALAETLDDSTRLRTPQIDGREANWNDALDLIATRFRAAIDEHGPDSVAFYVSGQCLTEDYYAANKLMKGFIGSGNIDTNSRLCMSSTVAGNLRAFGEDVVPGIYEDFDQADLIVLAGSNTAWCHPVLFQRMTAARARRGIRIVVIDPRRTATADEADLFLPLAPGSDVALFSGLLVYLADHNALDGDYISAHTRDFAATLATARAATPSIPAVAAATSLPIEDILQFYEWFAATKRSVTVTSQGINQSASGTDKVNAITNCHLATGRIGKPGMGPFSLTGQPNAMGGREVGGLANQLAAHMNLADPADRARVERFWRAPNMLCAPGLKAVDLFDQMAAGKIKALWVIATNPAVSMPRAEKARLGLDTCPFVVVSDCWSTDTTRYANVVLPAAGWGERDGTVTNSERMISRQRPFRAAPGEARPDWWMLAEVARRMGWAESFAWSGPDEIFAEHAALSAHENDGARIFNLAGLCNMNRESYNAMQPARWPITDQNGGRLFAEGGFPTPDRKARFIATAPRALMSAPDESHPFLLNTGRVRDQWHSMTRTGLAPRLMSHTTEPTLAIHPADAANLGLANGDLATITTHEGSAIVVIAHDTAQRRGELFIPMHWSDRNHSAGPVDLLVSGACDPISGQPDLKATAARLEIYETHWHGLMLARGTITPPHGAQWSRRAIKGGELLRLRGTSPHAPDQLPPTEGDLLEMTDAARSITRRVWLCEGRLEAGLFLARVASDLPSESFIASLLGQIIEPAQRIALLAGTANGPAQNEGQMLCSCFQVTKARIEQAVARQGLTTAAAVGDAIKAGTNCGSCVAEIKRLIARLQPVSAVPVASFQG